MNYRAIRYILGVILITEGALLLLPLLVSLIYQDGCWLSFIIVICLLEGCGWALRGKKPDNVNLYAKEGFVIVCFSWLFLSLFGALPFTISGYIPNYIDAFFETMSGFTTTGASILRDLDSMAPSLLFWRSFTHWIGGMGVLVFVMAIMPLGGDRSMHIMRAEVPGPVVGKLVPKMRNTALLLYAIYTVMTLILVILLLAGGMNLFEALLYSFGAAGTGGFTMSNAGIIGFDSVYIDVVITVFMFLFGINFSLFYYVLIRKFKLFFQNEELQVYLGIVLTAALLIALNILPQYGNFFTAFRYSVFQVSSIITTTGFSTADFNLWPQLSKTILLLLMIVGACAGSTGGGLKVSRAILLFKSGKREMGRMLHPRAVSAVRINGKAVDNVLVNATLVYLVMYAIILAISCLVLSLDPLCDTETTLSAVLACLNNIGPGLGAVGPMANYGSLTILSKLVLTLNMLIGRLEIFPVLLLCTRGAWKR